ncbi:MAG: hypothetical protein WAL72_05300 [Streptosporangiaceae bacterium]
MTSELGGLVTYFYWSQRHAEQLLDDNGIDRISVTRTMTSPSLHFMPTFSRSSTRQAKLKPQMAKIIETTLGQSAVTNFNSPGPIQYAKGRGSIVFGEFRV